MLTQKPPPAGIGRLLMKIYLVAMRLRWRFYRVSINQITFLKLLISRPPSSNFCEFDTKNLRLREKHFPPSTKIRPWRFCATFFMPIFRLQVWKFETFLQLSHKILQERGLDYEDFSINNLDLAIWITNLRIKCTKFCSKLFSILERFRTISF